MTKDINVHTSDGGSFVFHCPSVRDLFLNEDKKQERHSLFTSDFLSILGWHHSSTKTTISSHGLVNGYIEESMSNVSIRDIWNVLGKKSALTQSYTSSFSGLDTILIP